jgi:hypothetical protein
VVRFGFFPSRELAISAERKVLDYWRIELGEMVPSHAKNSVNSGYTETVHIRVGIENTWKVVRESKGFIKDSASVNYRQ